MKQRILLGALASLAIYGCNADSPALLAPGETANAAKNCDSTFFDPQGLAKKCAQLELVEEGYRFTEGPAVDHFGNVYFTDQPNNPDLPLGLEDGSGHHLPG